MTDPGKSIKDSSRKKTWKIGCTVLIIIGIAAVVSGILMLSIAREHCRRISCAGNLLSTGLAFKQYAMDYQDYFPDKNGVDGLETLYKEGYLSDYKVYICPSTTQEAPRQGRLISSYVYQGGLKDIPANAHKQLYWDHCGNHKNHINVLFCDGRVEAFTIDGDKVTRQKFKKCFPFFYDSQPAKLPPEILNAIKDRTHTK